MPPELHKNHDDYFVPRLRLGMQLLENLTDASRTLKVQEIAKQKAT